MLNKGVVGIAGTVEEIVTGLDALVTAELKIVVAVGVKFDV